MQNKTLSALEIVLITIFSSAVKNKNAALFPPVKLINSLAFVRLLNSKNDLFINYL